MVSTSYSFSEAMVTHSQDPQTLRITAMPRAVVYQGLNTHNPGGNCEFSRGQAALGCSWWTWRRRKGLRQSSGLQGVPPSSAVWMCMSTYGYLGQHLLYALTLWTPCLGARKGLGSAHPSLTSLTAESNVPASALGLDLVLDLVLERLFYSSSKDISLLKS